jgi:hypothetical protein
MVAVAGQWSSSVRAGQSTPGANITIAVPARTRSLFNINCFSNVYQIQVCGDSSKRLQSSLHSSGLNGRASHCTPIG